MQRLNTDMLVFLHARMLHAHMPACSYACMLICLHTRMPACSYACMLVCLHVLSAPTLSAQITFVFTCAGCDTDKVAFTTGVCHTGVCHTGVWHTAYITAQTNSLQLSLHYQHTLLAYTASLHCQPTLRSYPTVLHYRPTLYRVAQYRLHYQQTIPATPLKYTTDLHWNAKFRPAIYPGSALLSVRA